MFVLYKELNSYFITTYENYNSFIRNRNKCTRVYADNDKCAIDVALKYFDKDELIILFTNLYNGGNKWLNG